MWCVGAGTGKIRFNTDQSLHSRTSFSRIRGIISLRDFIKTRFTACQHRLRPNATKSKSMYLLKSLRNYEGRSTDFYEDAMIAAF